MDNVLFSWGHDEYMYKVLKHNNCLIPEEGLKIIKYHSAYVIHKENEYDYLMNKDDYKIRELCHQFSECDLYSKDINKIDPDELQPYYEKLIDKYFTNNILEW